jgi:hypothetical protein
MKISDCEYEARVTAATKTGEMPEALMQHVTTCNHCQETVAVTAALHKTVGSVVLPESLPEYRLIWIKAQVIQKQRNLSRLELIPKLGGVAIGLLVLLAILIWKSVMSATSGGSGGAASGPEWAQLFTSTLPFTITGAVLWIFSLLVPGRVRRRTIF